MGLQNALSEKIISKFTSPLDYDNAEVLMNAVLELIGRSPSGPPWCALTFDHIQEVDYVAAKMLMELADRLEAKRVRLAHISAEVEAFLLSGVLSTPEPDGMCPDAPTKTVRYFRLSGQL